MWQRNFLRRYPDVAARFSRKKARAWDAEKWNELMETLEKEAVVEDPRTLFAFSPDLVHCSVKHASRSTSPTKRPAPATATAPTTAVFRVVVPKSLKVPKDKFLAQKRAMKEKMKEIWGADLADADISRLVAEADFMARGVIPSVRQFGGAT